MARYEVQLTCYQTTRFHYDCTVEAASEQEAIDKACAKADDNEGDWHEGEADFDGEWWVDDVIRLRSRKKKVS